MDAAERKLLAGKQAEAQGKFKKAARKNRKVGKKVGSSIDKKGTFYVNEERGDEENDGRRYEENVPKRWIY